MIADRSQLNRWLMLLRNAAGDVGGSSSTVARSQRGRIVQALERVRSSRAGEPGGFSANAPNDPIQIPAPAAVGSSVAVALWDVYARFIAGDSDAESELMNAINALNPTALIAGISDNPEPWWQNEMLILHALHSFALIQRDEALLKKTLRCAQFHLEEIQPDHATNEPWAIHAYASHPDGTITAETLLHAAYMNGGGALNQTSRLIAHDAAAALEAYLAP